jgi:hypothetical protein
MTKEIQLTGGEIVLVDDRDYESLSQWKWSLFKGYPARCRKRLGVNRFVSMHREIVDPPKGVEVDHINGNKLDNRRENLRLSTRSQNQINQGLTRKNTSGYKGVTFHRVLNKWQSQIGIDGKTLYLGLYATPEEAARAYDAKARELFGGFARLNFAEE